MRGWLTPSPARSQEVGSPAPETGLMWANMLRAFQVGKALYQRRGAVDLDAVLAGGLGPGELAGVPFDEGFGFRRDVEVLVEAGVRLADLGVSMLDKQPIALTVRRGR